MSEETVKEVQLEEKVIGKTVLSFSKPTPMWANWIFRVVFILTGIAVFVVASDPSIPDAMKVRIGIYLKAADMLIWGMSKSIGIDIQRNFDIPA